jgi:hypothetical protein
VTESLFAGLIVAAMVAAQLPQTVVELARVAPEATWRRERMVGLDAEIVSLPTKEPHRFVVRGGRVAVATVEAAAPLFAPLDVSRAAALVAALRIGEAVDGAAPERLARAGVVVRRPPPPAPVGEGFVFSDFELRSASSQPQLVFVRLIVLASGRVIRTEHRVAEVVVDEAPLAASLPGQVRHVDRAAEIERFVRACRG